MNRRRRRALLAGGLLAWAGVLANAAPVAAECTQLDPWPSFTKAAPTAQRIVVGEVIQSYTDDSADNAIEFRLRVDEVLRGDAPPFLEFTEGTRSGMPLVVCPGDSILRVREGDVLAFAFDARIPTSRDPVMAVAWIRGEPDLFLMPASETLTLARVRELAALPATDTVTTSSTIPTTPLAAPLLLLGVGICAFVLALRRYRGLIPGSLNTGFESGANGRDPAAIAPNS